MIFVSVSLSRCIDNFVWDLKVLDEQLGMTMQLAFSHVEKPIFDDVLRVNRCFSGFPNLYKTSISFKDKK